MPSESLFLSPTQPRFIPTLDGWRALAVLLVIICHECLEHNVLTGWISSVGALGVKIFFGISGYLICTLLLVERQNTLGICLRDFYLRRAFRILPAAFTYLSFLLIATMFGWILIDRASVLACVFVIANNAPVGYFVNHFWSLSLEEQFYVVWPAVVAFAGVTGAKRIAGAAVVVIPFWRFIYAWMYHNSVPVNRSDMTLDVFFAPCLLAILLFKPENRKRATRILNFGTVMTLLIIAASCEIVHPSPAIRKAILTVIVPPVVVSTVLHPKWAVSSFLELGPVKWIGRISYSLYLWQQVFTSHAVVQPFAIRMLVLFAIAAASYYCIEQPAIRLGRRWIYKPQRHVGSVVAHTAA